MNLPENLAEKCFARSIGAVQERNLIKSAVSAGECIVKVLFFTEIRFRCEDDWFSKRSEVLNRNRLQNEVFHLFRSFLSISYHTVSRMSMVKSYFSTYMQKNKEQNNLLTPKLLNFV